jgi:hypothetical protein
VLMHADDGRVGQVSKARRPRRGDHRSQLHLDRRSFAANPRLI